MGIEGIQDKYVNPYTDFGFKLLFGTAMNKELLISFKTSPKTSASTATTDAADMAIILTSVVLDMGFFSFLLKSCPFVFSSIYFS